jgi:hypothetical protein
VDEEQLHMTSERDARSVDSVPVETARIMRTGSLWTAAGVVTPAVGLGPLLASGWRPAALPVELAVAWWLGALAAAAGLALLIWAGCPVLAYTLDRAYRQKVASIRIGIVLNVSGMVLAGAAVLLAPA